MISNFLPYVYYVKITIGYIYRSCNHSVDNGRYMSISTSVIAPSLEVSIDDEPSQSVAETELTIASLVSKHGTIITNFFKIRTINCRVCSVNWLLVFGHPSRYGLQESLSHPS